MFLSYVGVALCCNQITYFKSHFDIFVIQFPIERTKTKCGRIQPPFLMQMCPSNTILHRNILHKHQHEFLNIQPQFWPWYLARFLQCHISRSVAFIINLQDGKKRCFPLKQKELGSMELHLCEFLVHSSFYYYYLCVCWYEFLFHFIQFLVWVCGSQDEIDT